MDIRSKASSTRASRQLPKLVVDERQELLGGPGIALLDGAEDLRNVAHARGLQTDGDAHDYSRSVTP
jgi:hypothetical protein